jgi:hypothetical protein
MIRSAGVNGVPFQWRWSARLSACQGGPIANAGGNQFPSIGDTVTLDGRLSTAPGGGTHVSVDLTVLAEA